MTAPTRPIAVGRTVNAQPSPAPQTILSMAVGITFRCFPNRLPSGAKNSTVQYNVPPSRSMTSMTKWTPAPRAAAPSVAGVGPGTSIAASQ